MKRTKRPVTVLVGGTFNIIHPGHVWFLKRARALGDRLVVVVAHDRTVRAARKRLVFPARHRAAMVASLEFVDKVIIGYWPPDLEKMIRNVKPNIIALGYDQNLKIDKIDPSIKIVRIKKFSDYSTKEILKGS